MATGEALHAIEDDAPAYEATKTPSVPTSDWASALAVVTKDRTFIERHELVAAIVAANLAPMEPWGRDKDGKLHEAMAQLGFAQRKKRIDGVLKRVWTSLTT